MRAFRAALCTLVCALALGACGGGGTTIVTTATSPSTPRASATTGPPKTTTGTASTGTASTATPSTTTSATASLPLCTASGLRLGYLGGRGATGHGEVGFSLRNTTGHACHTFGYPGVLFRSSSGAPLRTRSVRATHDFFGSVPERGLRVAPGGVVSFRLATTHGEASDAGCTTAAQLQVIPPDDTHTLVVAIPNGVYECGSVTVSPVASGTSAFS